MPEAAFYHLERSDLEAALPPLLEKCLERGWRALVLGGSAERLDLLDEALWTWRDESFLPHGRDGRAAARQPVLLTQKPINANAAKALFLIDGAESFGLSSFERVSALFDGRDEAALAHARALWRRLKDDGLAATYWRQAADGSWTKQT